MFEDNDIPKYRKKRVKETPQKSKHKHIYDYQVLFHRVNNSGQEFYFSGYLCSVCGKRGDATFFETDGNGVWLKNDEILEKYKGLEIIEYE